MHEALLVSDIDHGAKMERAAKHMTALIGRLGIEHERNHSQLVWLTWAITALTLVLVGLTFVLIFSHRG
jgi:hypothetical protein